MNEPDVRKRAFFKMKHDEFVSLLNSVLAEAEKNKMQMDNRTLVIHLHNTAPKAVLRSPVEIAAKAEATADTLKKNQLQSNHKLVGIEGAGTLGLYNLGIVIRLEILQIGEQLRVTADCKNVPVLIKEFEHLWKEILQATDIRPTKNMLEALPEQIGVTKYEVPKWKTIVPNKGDDWQMLEIWDKNYTNSDIGRRLGKARRTITNRISHLRLRYPEAEISTAEERRKLLQKS